MKERIDRLIVISWLINLIKVKAWDPDRRIDGVEFELRILSDQWLKDPCLYMSVEVVANEPTLLVESWVEASEKWPLISLRLDFNFCVDILKICLSIAWDIFIIWPKTYYKIRLHTWYPNSYLLLREAFQLSRSHGHSARFINLRNLSSNIRSHWNPHSIFSSIFISGWTTLGKHHQASYMDIDMFQAANETPPHSVHPLGQWKLLSLYFRHFKLYNVLRQYLKV